MRSAKSKVAKKNGILGALCYGLCALHLALITSCSFPNYVFDNKYKTGVDFKSGKWLLNEVDAPVGVDKQITALAIADFSKLSNGRTEYVRDTKGLLLPQKKIRLSPSKLELQNLRKGTNFDYFISIKAANVRSDFDGVDVTPHRLNRGGRNENEVILEIYDLNSAEVIYTQRVVASVELPQDNSDVHVSKSGANLMVNAYKKIAKQLKEHSAY